MAITQDKVDELSAGYSYMGYDEDGDAICYEDGMVTVAEVPVVPDLDARVLAVVEKDPRKLYMHAWHRALVWDEWEERKVAREVEVDEAEAFGDTCGTAHCRAGWAIHLAGKAGYALERKVGPEAAGALIYEASAGYVPDFFVEDDEAIADMRERVGKTG